MGRTWPLRKQSFLTFSDLARLRPSAAPRTDGKWHPLAVISDQDTADGKVTGRRVIDGKPGNQAASANQSRRRGNRTVRVEGCARRRTQVLQAGAQVEDL